MKNYELIEHTADIGIRVKARDLKDLFKNAALATFDIIAEKKPETNPSTTLGTDDERSLSARNQKPENIIVKQEADNLEELFVNWLNELLSLSAVKDLIFCDFKINKLNENNLKAIAIGNDIKNYKVNTEIKAATYHELKLEKTKSVWQAEVIFDV